MHDSLDEKWPPHWLRIRFKSSHVFEGSFNSLLTYWPIELASSPDAMSVKFPNVIAGFLTIPDTHLGREKVMPVIALA